MKNKKLLSDIKEYLKYYENQVLEDWYELIRHISVSETGEGIETCCDWIQKKMEEIGIQVTKYSVKPAPVLVGRFGNDPEKKTEREYSSALRVYNKRLDSLSSLLELDEPLTSYVARHTWASLARQCGTSDTVISEAMGHSHVGVTTIYLASLDIGMVAMANQRVITSLFRKRIP